MYIELIIMILCIIFAVIIAGKWFINWLKSPATISKIKLGKGGKVKENDPNVKFLQAKGYEVISCRHIIPYGIELNGEMLERAANVYIDYVAEKNGKAYIVRYERERKPLEYTSNQIKDQLLMYHLLLPDMCGILYINSKTEQINKISFHYLE